MGDGQAHIRHELDFSGAEWLPAVPDGYTAENPVYLAWVPHTDGVTYVAMWHSSNPDLTLVFTPDEWQAFVEGAQLGEFDESW